MKSFRLLKVLFVILVATRFGEVKAESVVVKYRGLVNLKGFDCHSLDSSFVLRACYNGRHQYLIVLLQSTYYHYCRIPAEKVTQLLGADSKGAFFNNEIKGRFDCRMGGVPVE